MSGAIADLLSTKGWVRFPFDAGSLRWAGAALPRAVAAVGPDRPDWRSGGTWCVGLDALDNHPDGSVGGVALAGAAADAVRALFGPRRWHRAQLSTVRPGYPQPSAEETETAYRFRRNRDAAHVDGLIRGDADGRRRLREPHAFILGIALNDADPGASPLVVWEGSHRIMGEAFRSVLGPGPATQYRRRDITDAYQAARRTVFEGCARVPLPLRRGEAVLLHRLALHGVAPWAEGAGAPLEGRIIAYFRPELKRVGDWFGLP